MKSILSSKNDVVVAAERVRGALEKSAELERLQTEMQEQLTGFEQQQRHAINQQTNLKKSQADALRGSDERALSRIRKTILETQAIIEEAATGEKLIRDDLRSLGDDIREAAADLEAAKKSFWRHTADGLVESITGQIGDDIKRLYVALVLRDRHLLGAHHTLDTVLKSLVERLAIPYQQPGMFAGTNSAAAEEFGRIKSEIEGEVFG